MKRKAPPHGKKESAEMQSSTAADFGPTEKRTEKRLENPDAQPNDKISELRKKIRSGYYGSKEVMMEIVNKLLNEVK